jgi:MarC family membrane protein
VRAAVVVAVAVIVRVVPVATVPVRTLFVFAVVAGHTGAAVGVGARARDTVAAGGRRPFPGSLFAVHYIRGIRRGAPRPQPGDHAMTIFSAAILLFFVMDPIGNIPLFLAALGPVEPERRARVVGRELFIAYGLLVGFLLAGRPLLATLHISEPALTMAGGIVLFLIAIRMTFPAAHGPLGERVEGEPFVVPLAIPYVAGPSALATVLLLTSREPERLGEWFAAVTLAWLASATILLLSQPLARLLGEKGITAIERLMGMVLVASAVQMFLDGVRKALAAPDRCSSSP